MDEILPWEGETKDRFHRKRVNVHDCFSIKRKKGENHCVEKKSVAEK